MEFINLTTPANGGPVGAPLQVDKTNRRRIRIQVMKDFRRKKQQQSVVRKMDYSIMATSRYLELIVSSPHRSAGRAVVLCRLARSTNTAISPVPDSMAAFFRSQDD
jgi:hypothetical protein